MAMAANRHAGVRAAVCHDAYTAEMARRHNNANVLCLGARVLGVGVAVQVLEVFLDSAFDDGRHRRRVAKIELGVEGEKS
jgi:ribose 5-phosphate isomerase B